MCIEKQIVLQNVFYSIPNSNVNFNNINLSFQQNLYGIVGDNGIGKTSLLRLITQQIQATKGSIKSNGTVFYCPQATVEYQHKTIAQVLEIDQKLIALEKIASGSIDNKYYETIGDDWDIKTKALAQLELFQLNNIHLNQSFSSLSGGQKTKLLLTKAVLSNSDFVLLDEPTNNLDKSTREILYKWIKNFNKGLIIVSHNRELLEIMNHIIEINQHGINSYGGDYDFYLKQKNIEQTSLSEKINNAKKQLKKANDSIQSSKEKHAQKAKKGKALRKNGSIDKLSANSKMGRSEKTLSRNNILEQRLSETAQKHLTQAKEKLEIKTHITANLDQTYLANNKTVLAIENLNFSYQDKDKNINYLFKNFNLTIAGPERIAIAGKNGAGKSTLVKLILEELLPLSGQVNLFITNHCYLDQNISNLDHDLSIMDNYLKLNPNVSSEQAYFHLASMNFRSHSTTKLVKHLSGGEKIRAGLAISLLSHTPPQLILLDEPTNQLDITSIQAIENLLNHYQGALIVISHDEYFLNKINITRKIHL